jgi:hypothetical protein
MKKWEFTHSVGKILEVKAMSDVDISSTRTHDGYVSSVKGKTTHYSKCRIKWKNNKESFATLNGEYSIGDDIAMIYTEDRFAAELNVNTGSYKCYDNQAFSKKDELINAILFTVFGLLTIVTIGLPFLIVTIIRHIRIKKEFRNQIAQYIKTL